MMEYMCELVHRNKFADRLITDYDYRTVVFSVFSCAGNMAYAVFNIFAAVFSHSMWCGALACYYTVLVFLRGYLLMNYYKAYKENRINTVQERLLEVKRYRLCGAVFLALVFCLGAIILLIVRAEKVFEYELYMIYTIAGYTLYQIAVAVTNYIKAQRADNFTVRSLRCINLTAALVSFLSLQAIALDTFSKNIDIPHANAITGFIVCGLIVASGIFMIVKSNRKIKQA